MAYLFHLECVRRNSDYRVDYEKWVEADKSMDFWIHNFWLKWRIMDSEPPNPDELVDLEKILDQEELFKSLWRDISVPTNEMVAHESIKSCFVTKDISRIQSKFLKGHLVMLYFPEEKEFNWTNTVAVVDMSRPKEEIKRSVSQKIEKWVLSRKAAGLKQKNTEEKIHLEEAFQYLKAFDLKKSGMSDEKIAQIMKKKKAASMDSREAKRYRLNAEKYIANPPLLKYSQKDYQEKVQRFLQG